MPITLGRDEDAPFQKVPAQMDVSMRQEKVAQDAVCQERLTEAENTLPRYYTALPGARSVPDGDHFLDRALKLVIQSHAEAYLGFLVEKWSFYSPICRCQLAGKGLRPCGPPFSHFPLAFSPPHLIFFSKVSFSFTHSFLISPLSVSSSPLYPPLALLFFFLIISLNFFLISLISLTTISQLLSSPAISLLSRFF